MEHIKKDKGKHDIIITKIKPALDYRLVDFKDTAVCTAALLGCDIGTGRVVVTSNALFVMNGIVSFSIG